MRWRTSIGAVAALAAAATFCITSLAANQVSAAPINQTVALACNNTFNATKFPLEYKVTATPSSNPVAPSSSFTVKFDVTVIASAGFLNAVYTALGGKTALPIAADKATIGVLQGATGPNVSVAIKSTYTIPEPAAVPVTVGAEIGRAHV